MSYLDYRKLPKKIYCIVILIIVAWMIFISGLSLGKTVQKEQDRLYVGRVIEKEYVPEKIENGERYDEAYYIVVEDNHGEMLRYSVSKDVYQQIDIGEMYRRKQGVILSGKRWNDEEVNFIIANIQDDLETQYNKFIFSK